MLIKAMGFSTLLVAFVAGGFWGWVGFTAVVILAGLASTGYFIETYGKVTIPELTVGVVFRKKGNQFDRFLEPGTHWVNPYRETITSYINTAGQSTHGRGQNIQAIGGLTVSTEWTANYTLQPEKISAAKRPKLARALPHKADAIAHQQINNILHHVIGDYTIEQLSEPGTHRRLERQVRQMARTRLEPLGYALNNFMLDALHLPAQVRATLEAAHERTIQAEQEAQALERLHKVITQFSDADVERLIELERIQRMGQMGVAMVYPTLTEQGVMYGQGMGRGAHGRHGRVVIQN